MSSVSKDSTIAGNIDSGLNYTATIIDSIFEDAVEFDLIGIKDYYQNFTTTEILQTNLQISIR